jgi:hypothetical protein
VSGPQERGCRRSLAVGAAVERGSFTAQPRIAWDPGLDARGASKPPGPRCPAKRTARRVSFAASGSRSAYHAVPLVAP